MIAFFTFSLIFTHAPLEAIVGAVLFKAARREQSAIPQKIQRTLVQTLCKLESPSSEAVNA